MAEIHRRALVVVLCLICGLASAYGQSVGDYGTQAPKIEADRVLSFSWENVDKYPVITAMAFVPGRAQLLTGGDDCRLCLWNLENGALIQNFVAHEDWIRGLAFSPDGTLFASVGQDGTLKLWNASDFSLKLTFSEKLTGAQGLAFSPDGTKLAICGFEDYVALFNVADGMLLGKWKMPGTSNTVIRYSPDGRLLAAAGRDGTIRVWETGSMKSADLSASDRRVLDLAFNANGMLLASGGEDGTLTIWDVATGKKALSIPTTIGKTFSLGFCGPYLASGDSLNSIRIWNLETGREVARCLGHTGTVAVMEFHADDNELTSAGFDTTVRFWPLGTIK